MSTSQFQPFLDTLIERLESKENLEVEFKRGRGGLPKDLWPTVSAFANTNGGWIVLGVREEGDVPTVEGLSNPYARLQELNDLLRNPNKINIPVCGPEDVRIEPLGSEWLLLLRVSAASRKVRPVYINGNPYTGTYVRRHSGDYHCTKQEVDRMMRDASDVAADSGILSRFDLRDLDADALARYRRRFQTRDPASPWNGYPDQRFLQAIGGFRRDRNTGEEGITVAGLLMLGTPEAIRDWRSRHLIDYRLLPEDAAGDRWDDRVPWDGNLLGAFEVFYPRLVANQPVPFRLRDATRTDQSPVHVAVREALVNLLVHADYAETQASLVTRSSEGYLFRNPGSSRVPTDDLLTGDRSDPRNPVLVPMFRLIGLADEAGTGIPKIIQAWRELGLRLPAIDSGTERYEFTLRLRYAHLLSEDDRVWLQSMGGGWTEAEQLAMVLARHDGSVDNPTLRRVTGQHSADVSKVLVGLRDRDLLRKQKSGRHTYYELGDAAIPGERAPSLLDNESNLLDNEPSLLDNEPSLLDNERGLRGSEVHTDEVLSTINRIADPVRGRRLSPAVLENVIVRLCAVAPLSAQELADFLGKTNAYVGGAVRKLIAAGRLSFLFPEQPRHPRQRYIGTGGVSDTAVQEIWLDAPNKPAP